ncbi:hypothetical protein C9374_012274 [Naegleria lovaniensis]|uniref:Aldehyde dehydrogenase domain-containing protein n=1 Tax=Naegleria lovaniensis TaxID=51637 RepID=A0AA88GD58_NAELO|nr:uncharacterized protein C9374_012274 [Naegleria lovaniensis]KAG2373285.1 hypothetical protein C9374_012274 [Naegleria lovaniensis]
MMQPPQDSTLLQEPPANIPASTKNGIPSHHLPSSSTCASEPLPQIIYNFIGGKFMSDDSSHHSIHTDEWIINKSPATNQIISYIPASSDRHVQQAVDASKKCWRERSWRGLSEEERAQYLDKIANEIERRMDEFARAESLDTGKPFTLAKNMDIARAVSNFRFFAQAIRQSHTKAHLMSDKVINYTTRRPAGIVGVIVPWNLPIYLLSWKVAPALACGNCVVAKSSELTPLTANLLAEVVRDVKLPNGAFNLLHGYGRDCGRAIVAHPDINVITFTGGTATGRVVAELASRHFKKLSLELGGKNPFIVFPDCDLDKAIETAKRAAFLNQGQICLCASRFIVHESIHDQFVERLKKLTEETTKIGNPLDATTTFGSQISLEHLEKIEYYVKLAQHEGGTIVTGGKRPDLTQHDPQLKEGAFFTPTIITGLDYKSRTATEEIFGPVCTVHKFSTDEQALEMANHVDYGLCATLFTNNLTRAHRFSDELESGIVWVNTWLLRDLRTPFGGMKKSGLHREGGEYSLEFYSEDKNICINL